MKAFNNNPIEKFNTVCKLQSYADSGRLVQGYYWNERQGNGCAIGVLTTEHTQNAFRKKYDLPWFIGKLLERVFESYPLETARNVVQVFVQAIPVGADMNDYMSRLVFEILLKKGHASDSMEPSLRSLELLRDSYKPGSKMRIVMDALVYSDVKRWEFVAHWFERQRDEAFALMIAVMAKSKETVPVKKLKRETEKLDANTWFERYGDTMPEAEQEISTTEASSDGKIASNAGTGHKVNASG